MDVIAERPRSASPAVAPSRTRAGAAGGALPDAVLAARRRTATLVCLLALGGAVALWSALIVRATGGSFNYTIDDPYIHLSIARNLATSGTYGVVPGVYESASSSPGWVALLAGLIRVAPGAAEWFPFALNVLAAAGVLVLVVRSQRWLFAIEPALGRGLASVALPVAMFLPGLVLTGMEHTLHALLVVALLLILARALRRPLSRRELAATVGLAIVAGAVRYETLFVAGGAALALVVVPPATSAGAPGVRAAVGRLRRPEVWAFLLPPLSVVGVLAAINLHNGQYALPNSVLAKSGLGAGSGLGAWVPNPGVALDRLFSDKVVAAAVLFGVGYLAVRRLGGEQSGLWLAFLVTAALHAGYAQFGWFDRYQGYLVVAGVLLMLRSLPEARLIAPRRYLLVAAVLLAGVPISKYTLQTQAPDYGLRVHQLQATMGRFLGAEYMADTVLVNDIGEVSWQHRRGGLDDIWALGSYDVLRAYRAGRMGPDFVEGLARRDRVQVAAIWAALDHYIPADFVQVARWSVAGTGKPSADNDIVFWAPNQAAAAVLRSRMEQFTGAGGLPAGVEVLWPTGRPA